MTLEELLTDADFQPAVEPSKIWRNRWKWGPVGGILRCKVCGRTEKPPCIVIVCCVTHPSKDIAETKAAEELARGRSFSYLLPTYLGAVPE